MNPHKHNKHISNSNSNNDNITRNNKYSNNNNNSYNSNSNNINKEKPLNKNYYNKNNTNTEYLETKPQLSSRILQMNFMKKNTNFNIGNTNTDTNNKENNTIKLKSTLNIDNDIQKINETLFKQTGENWELADVIDSALLASQDKFDRKPQPLLSKIMLNGSRRIIKKKKEIEGDDDNEYKSRFDLKNYINKRKSKK